MTPEAWLGLAMICLGLLVALAWWDLRSILMRGASESARPVLRRDQLRALKPEPRPTTPPPPPPAPRGDLFRTPEGAGPRTAPPSPVETTMLSDHRRLLAPPPMCQGVTVRDYLINHTGRDGVWSEVVSEFYAAAASDPEVLDYFRVVLSRPDGMAALQGHFLRALTLVTHQGVTAVLASYLGRKHAPVLSSTGQPITAGVWDKVVGALVDVLKAKGLPDEGIAALATTIAPFRAAIVRPEKLEG